MEVIVAQQSDDFTTGSLPASATIKWDIQSVAQNTNDSLSGAIFSSYGKVENYYLQTIPDPGFTIVGGLSTGVARVSALGEYGQPTFNFVSGGNLVMVLTGDYAVTQSVLGNAAGYPTANGTLTYSTQQYVINSTISLSASELSATYIADYGLYTPNSYVNAASANILDIDMQTLNYMYRITGDLSTSDIRNPDGNLSAFEYFPQRPDNIDLQVTYFDNLPEQRTIILELVNVVDGQTGPFPPYSNGYWEISASSPNVTIDIYGDPSYGWNKKYYLTATKFNSQTQTPENYTITVSPSYFNNGVEISTHSYTFTIDQFPDEESFSCRSTISNNIPSAVGVALSGGGYSQRLWRHVTQPTVSAQPFIQIPGWDQTQGTLGIDWGDGNISAYPTLTTTVKHSYAVPPIDTFRIITIAEGISAQNWLSAHSNSDISGYMDIQFVDRFLSGNFIAYPDYYFDTNGDYVLLNTSNYTQSVGVCAYGEGSNVVINLSAAEPELGKNTLYQWGIDYKDGLSGVPTYSDIISAQNAERQSIYEFGDVSTYTPEGSALSLIVFDDDFPYGMNPWYYNDDNEYVKYPNFDTYDYAHTTSANNSDKLFQNVRVLPYENVIFSLAPIGQTVTPDSVVITSVLSLSFPSYSPVSIAGETYQWTLSALGWSSAVVVETTSRNFSYSITEGSGITPGTLVANTTVPITLSLSGQITKTISARDFENNTETILSDTLSATVVGGFDLNPKIFTSDLHTLTGETIFFENITTVSTSGSQPSAYIWDVGDGSGYITVSSTDTYLIPATYMDVGTYSIGVTAITTDGVVIPKQFSDIITVESYYPAYSEDVRRIYGSEGIAFEYDFTDIMVKPNEWAVADNINSALYKLNANIEYLKSVAKKYIEPPTKLYGWLGQSKYNESDISWHVIIPGISAEYASTENIDNNSRGINDIRDVSIYNDDIYLMTSTAVYILSSDYSATEIDTRSIKTIGDPFYNLISMGINSTGRIYLLDSEVHKIVVFDTYNGTWRFLYSFGNYGGLASIQGFSIPVDLHIDSQDNVWVTDNGNKVIKKFTNNGSWMLNITHNNFGDLVSTAVDDDENVHVLMTTGVMKFSSTGDYIATYDVTPSGQTANKIINGRDGFMYISYDTSTVKITKDGAYAGSFGNTLSDVSYGGIFQDTKRNLYITNTNSIIKYYDKVSIDSIIKPINDIGWDIEDIYIDSDEYIQDWVYNKAFSRLWDNMELLKRSINGSIYQITDSQGNIKNLITGFTPEQYALLFDLPTKEEIFIGINEIVTADSINRCLRKLYSILEVLFNAIKGETDSNI